MFEYPKIAGSQIEPGMFRIDHDDYHNGIGVSSTTLKKVLISPAHSLIEEEDKPHFAFGRSFHMRLIEPEIWDANNVVLPNIYRRSKAEKFFWELVGLARTGPCKLDGDQKLMVLDAMRGHTAHVDRMFELFEKGMEGVEIISQDEKDLIDTMAQAVEKTSPWDEMRHYDGETAGFAIDDDTGELMKCKADLLGGDMIVDVKTTGKCAKPEIFLKEAIGYNYHVSAAYYEEILYRNTGRRFDFVWLVVEKKAPFGVSFVRCPPELFEVGRQKWRQALDIYSSCKREDHWPCYPDYIVDLPAPAWALKG